MAKRLELLNEATPATTRIGEGNGPVLTAMKGTAMALGVRLQVIEVSRSAELESAFSGLADQQIEAIVVGDHGFFLAEANRISALASKHRFPSIGPLEHSPIMLQHILRR
jgi:hypothetical protein